jgi:periplasmic protein TonB
MPSASLAVVRRAQPDMVRVAALSVAMTLNIAALMFAMRPLAPQIAETLQTVSVETVRLIEPPPPVPPPPAIELKPLPKPIPIPITPPVHTVHVQQNVAPVTTVVPTTVPSDNSKPVTVPQGNVNPPPQIAPGVVSLAYRSSPLKFPVQALRQRMSGTVLLRVLVDERGKPVDVVVEQSSGFKLLDNSAREQVLSTWLFQPAVIEGHTVKAWARVPVSFTLQDL